MPRRPDEPVDPALREFHLKLLKAVDHDVFRNGSWQLCERSGWPDNSSFQNLVAWCWIGDTDRYLIIVNLSDTQSQGLVKVPWEDLQERTCHLTDALSVETYDRDGNEMRAPGLFVDLIPWAIHCFHAQLADTRETMTRRASQSARQAELSRT